MGQILYSWLRGKGEEGELLYFYSRRGLRMQIQGGLRVEERICWVPCLHTLPSSLRVEYYVTKEEGSIMVSFLSTTPTPGDCPEGRLNLSVLVMI